MTTMDDLSPQQLADQVGTVMFAKDRASIALGMAVARIGPGSATLTMTVREDMLNGADVCHGGLITTLADSAFAYACNSRNLLTLASGLSTDFVASALLGDVLTADAVEVVLKGNTGVYDVIVRNQNEQVIATFRGRSHRMKGRHTCP
jgi:acyl-CoA thioesterase